MRNLEFNRTCPSCWNTLLRETKANKMRLQFLLVFVAALLVVILLSIVFLFLGR